MRCRLVRATVAAALLMTAPMLCPVASASEDQPSSSVRPRTWPSPIVLLTVDRVAPAHPSVVVVVAPEQDTRDEAGPSGELSSLTPFTVALGVSSAVAFVTLRTESVRRTSRRRA